MRRYIALSAVLHLLVFLLAGIPLFLRIQEDEPPPSMSIEISDFPMFEEPTPEEDETPEKTPTPDLTQMRSMLDDDELETPTATPTSTPTEKVTDTATPTETHTPEEATSTPTPTETTLDATNTPTAKPSETPKPSDTPKPTATKKPTPKPTETKKPTPKPTNTAKATETPKATESPTPDKTKQAIAKAAMDLSKAIKGAGDSQSTSPVPVAGFGQGGGMKTTRPFGDAGYLARLRALLQENFSPPRVPQGSKKYVATVYFKIGAAGEITDITIADESGHKGVDRAAIEAVKKVGRVDKLPFGTIDLGVTCEFVVE